MDVLAIILFPIIYVLRIILDTAYGVVGNYGVAIFILCVFVNIISLPLFRYARKIEQSEKDLHDQMAPQLAEAKENYKGEKRFKAIEKIYQEHNYHPIKSIKSVAGFALQLPLLLSNLILLLDYPPLIGQGFVLLSDLSQQDGLLPLAGVSINLLPLIMAAITLVETKLKPEMANPAKMRFYFITLGILVLIYPLPSGVVLYWTTNNIISLGRTLLSVRFLRRNGVGEFFS